MSLEIEIKTLLTFEQYQSLFLLFHKEAVVLNFEEQETYYFDCAQDLRIQKSSKSAKICLKKGKLHDEAREEIEIPVAHEHFPALEKLMLELGYGVKVKWFRKRYTFAWQGIKAMLDDTKGYGQILELEQVLESREGEVVEVGVERETLHFLHEKLAQLGLKATPREIFDERYNYYIAHWQELVGE